MADVTKINFNEDYLGDGNGNYYASGNSAIDITKGGQWGALPRIGGADNGNTINESMHEQSYLRKDLIPIVLSTPKMFEHLPNSKKWKAALKAFVEVHSKTITGLDSSLTVETTEKELGVSGAVMKEVVKVTRAQSSVTHTVTEKDGNPFEIILDVWIRYGLLDPDLDAPLMTKLLPDNVEWTVDMWTMTVLYIEPDALLKKAIRGWLVSNLFPMGNPDIVGDKDKSTAKSAKEISIELGGFALPHTNARVAKLSNTMLKNMELWNLNPDEILLQADKVDPSLLGIENSSIYYEGNKGGDDNVAMM